MTPTITVSQSGGVTLAIEYQTNTTGFTGTTGSTDNAILRANGTGGTVIQGSLATIADDGTLDAPAITVDGDPVALKDATKQVFIPIAQMFGNGSHAAQELDYTPGTGRMYKVLNFPNSAQTHSAEFDFFFPPDADTEQPITFKAVWRSPSYPTATGTVSWLLRVQPFPFDQSPDLALGTTFTSTPSADNPIRYDTFSVEYVPSAAADFWRFQLDRTGGDSFDGDIYLLGVILTYSTL
jgi:hypothetical protein